MPTPAEELDNLQSLLDKAIEDLARFDSQPAMVSYEAQRQQIYRQAFAIRDAELRVLDAQHKELLKIRLNLLAEQARADLELQDLKARYGSEIAEASNTRNTEAGQTSG